MATGAITKRKMVPSILIDKNFIRKFGNILETQIKERKLEAEARIKEVVKKREEEIKKSSYYKEEEKDQVIEEMRRHEERMNEPHMSVKYELNTNDNETTEFYSCEDILSTDLLPLNIKSLSVHVHHYNNNFVDISVNLDKPYSFFGVFNNSEVSLSSKNEAELLKKTSELDKLFKEFKSGYHYFIYLKSFSPFILLTALSTTTGIFYILYEHKLFTKDFGILYLYLNIMVYYFTGIFLRYIFPFYEFELTQASNIKKYLRIFFGFISSGLILNGVYDLIKFLLIHSR